jgi:hypothetical protein
MSLNGPISWSEKLKKLHENPNHIPRLGDILIPINPLPPRGFTKFFKLECNGELKEGDRIIRVEFLGSTTCVLS